MSGEFIGGDETSTPLGAAYVDFVDTNERTTAAFVTWTLDPTSNLPDGLDQRWQENEAEAFGALVSKLLDETYGEERAQSITDAMHFARAHRQEHFAILDSPDTQPAFDAQLDPLKDHGSTHKTVNRIIDTTIADQDIVDQLQTLYYAASATDYQKLRDVVESEQSKKEQGLSQQITKRQQRLDRLMLCTAGLGIAATGIAVFFARRR